MSDTVEHLETPDAEDMNHEVLSMSDEEFMNQSETDLIEAQLEEGADEDELPEESSDENSDQSLGDDEYDEEESDEQKKKKEMVEVVFVVSNGEDKNTDGEKSKRRGEEKFSVTGYYSNFSSLAKGIVRHQIHDIDFGEVTTLGQLAEKFAENISDVMSTMGVSIADRAVERLLSESGTRIHLKTKDA